jgi:hypothetical protein
MIISKKISHLLVLLLFATMQPLFAIQSTSLTILVTDIKNEQIINLTARLKIKDKTIKEIKKDNDKPLIFFNLEENEYILEVDANGFKPFSKLIKLESGKNSINIILEIKEILENVDVKPDKTTTLIDNAFNGFFTKEQIEALPETGEEIEKEIRRRYGPDVIIKVDGFSDRVPDKSRIASIKATQSSYDAENHELGFTYVEITTKVGEESFGGSFGYDFSNQILNARQSLSKDKLPETKNNFSLYLFGPIKQKRTAFDFSVFQTNNLLKTNIIAISPNGETPFYSSTNRKGTSLSTKIYHNLTKNHNLSFTYSFQHSLSTNLGVGGFDLPERAYANKLNSQKITLSESGYFKNKYFNEVRLFFQSNRKVTTPKFDLPTIRVLDTFTSGGAGNGSDGKELSFWVSNNFLFGYKNHAIKLGGMFEVHSAKETSRVNERGIFTFSSLNDYLVNKPSLFTQTPDSRSSNIVTQRISVFLQDDFKVKRNLGISLGLRYEAQNRISDFNNFSPRLGFTWVPPLIQNTVIRGGVGIFYNWIELANFAYISNRSIFRPTEITIFNPTFPLISLNSATNSPLGYWQLAKNIQNPAIFHTSIGSNSSLGKRNQLQINYVFQKGAKMLRTIDLNFPINGLRPNLNFNNIFQVESSGFYTLNKIDLNFSGVLRKGVTYGIKYSLQKKISDSEGIFSFPSNNSNLKADISPANDDQRHRISGNLSWKIRRGILLTAIYRIDSPLPYTITTGFDDNKDTIFNDRPKGLSRNSERGEWKGQLDLGLSYTISFWDYDKSRKGKTVIIYSGSEITRDNETIEDKKRFQAKFYFSAFNLFNSSNFNGYVGVQTSPFFRHPISSSTSRTIDLGIRFGF